MDDRARVEALLGRCPRGDFDVVVRDPSGDPVVIRNAPLLDDGTPMPTRYYLVGADLVRDVSRLEAAGGVKQAEASIAPDEIAAAHRRYAAERDAAMPADHDGPQPSGGVGGTREGVKCLHAHVAYALAGGDDPVGRWALARLDVVDSDQRAADLTTDTSLHVHIGDDVLTVWVAGGPAVALPVTPQSLYDDQLEGSDLPAPEQLTNALGAVTDHLDDAFVEVPGFLDASGVTLSGPHALALAQVEYGGDALPDDYGFGRAAVDEVFRTLATERRAERGANPGLAELHLDTVVPTCCVVLAVLRRLELGGAAFDPAGVAPAAAAEGPWR